LYLSIKTNAWSHRGKKTSLVSEHKNKCLVPQGEKNLSCI
jgi:hypothetical protein